MEKSVDRRVDWSNGQMIAKWINWKVERCKSRFIQCLCHHSFDQLGRSFSWELQFQVGEGLWDKNLVNLLSVNCFFDSLSVLDSFPSLLILQQTWGDMPWVLTQYLILFSYQCGKMNSMVLPRKITSNTFWLIIVLLCCSVLIFSPYSLLCWS